MRAKELTAAHSIPRPGELVGGSAAPLYRKKSGKIFRALGSEQMLRQKRQALSKVYQRDYSLTHEQAQLLANTNFVHITSPKGGIIYDFNVYGPESAQHPDVHKLANSVAKSYARIGHKAKETPLLVNGERVALSPERTYALHVETANNPEIEERANWLSRTTASYNTPELEQTIMQWKKDLPDHRTVISKMKGSIFRRRSASMVSPYTLIERSATKKDMKTLRELVQLSRAVVEKYHGDKNWDELSETDKRHVRLGEATAFIIESLSVQKMAQEYPQERFEKIVPIMEHLNRSNDIPPDFKEKVIAPYVRISTTQT